MKKRHFEEDEDTTEKYLHYSPEQKDILANVALGLKGENWKKGKILDFLKGINFPAPRSTLNGWMSNMEEYGSATLGYQIDRRPRLLDEEKQVILAGFIFHSNEISKEVRESDIVEFVESKWDMKMTRWTAGNYPW